MASAVAGPQFLGSHVLPFLHQQSICVRLSVRSGSLLPDGNSALDEPMMSDSLVMRSSSPSSSTSMSGPPAERHTVTSLNVQRHQLPLDVAGTWTDSNHFAPIGFSLAASGIVIPPVVFPRHRRGRVQRTKTSLYYPNLVPYYPNLVPPVEGWSACPVASPAHFRCWPSGTLVVGVLSTWEAA